MDAIREIGVQWDAALVITTKRPTPQSSPTSDTFNVWSVSLTSHVVAPLLTGVNLRLFDWQRFASGTAQELPVLYDNCRACSANTYFTAFYYDVRSSYLGGAMDARRPGRARVECQPSLL